MRPSLFITGSSGFIGTQLLSRMDLAKYTHVYCLSRSAAPVTPRLSSCTNITCITGSIHDSQQYLPYLAASDTVIHLAAATGTLRPQEYFSVNAKGTDYLLRQCRDVNVRQFLHLSTIAVTYSDTRRYYYAQSKQLAEAAVASSGLRYTIVRPTIVIGRNGPLWTRLSQLARKPILPVLGPGTTKIQPIDVDDLAACLLRIVDENRFADDIVELGGPEQLSIETFLRKIHSLYSGNRPRVLHVPAKPVTVLLSALEALFPSALPVSVGQLSIFTNDGTIRANSLFQEQMPRMKRVDEMLRLAMGNE
jgi:NADH dehydrogenase